MNDIFKIYDFEDEEHWLKGRMNGIGGSDASAVMGKNPYKVISICLKKKLEGQYRKIYRTSLM